MPLLADPALAAGCLAAEEQPTLDAGDGIILRPWLLVDAPAVQEAFDDPEIQRWHVRRAESVEEARGWIESWRETWQRETDIHWAIADERKGTVLGRMSLKTLNLYDGLAVAAYWVAPWSRGVGVCTRALGAAADWAFGVGFHRLQLSHSTANTASCRVAEKTGFAAEGLRRASGKHADGWHDMHVHARFREA
ncbi:MAG: GNAT family N-acetyltransferase [Hamadaea sp.]|nr:GNAT family N-acetyltransferase [Hamadaea sp.]